MMTTLEPPSFRALSIVGTHVLFMGISLIEKERPSIMYICHQITSTLQLVHIVRACDGLKLDRLPLKSQLNCCPSAINSRPLPVENAPFCRF